MVPILQVDKLSGGYSPRKPVLNNISFKVRPGEIIGFIGLNGAGKSTTMRHILGLMKPQSGTIRMNGQTIEEAPDAYRSSYAYVPESPLYYEELTVKEHLELTAMAYGIAKDTYAQRVEPLLAEFQMIDKLDSLPSHLSKGMRQKLMIMNVFLVRPALYMIDEPFLGLDPLGMRSLLERMVQVKQSGASVLMSSHILSTIEGYCDRFIVLHHGSIIAQGTLADLRETAGLPQAGLEEAFIRLVTNGPAV